MPRRKPQAPAENEQERRYLEALERIKAGKPTDPDLKARAARGKLEVTISAVAKEARQSRTLIGHAGCEYPRVRDAVLAAMRLPEQPQGPARNHTEVFNRLREEIVALQEAVKLRDSENANLVARLAQIEAEVERANALAERVRNREGDPDKVVPIRPRGGPKRHG